MRRSPLTGQQPNTSSSAIRRAALLHQARLPLPGADSADDDAEPGSPADLFKIDEVPQWLPLCATMRASVLHAAFHHRP